MCNCDASFQESAIEIAEKKAKDIRGLEKECEWFSYSVDISDI